MSAISLYYNLASPLIMSENSSVTGVEGRSIVLTFNVFDAFPPVTIDNVRWLLNREGIITDITNNTMVDNNILTFESNSTTQTYSLTISNIQPNYTSRFILRVSNPAGVDSNFTDLIVEGIQNIYSFIMLFIVLCLGGSKGSTVL